MESIHHIKSRIKTVKNVGQITRAMELVAATKMRKSQEIALRSRPYAYGILEFLQSIRANENIDSPFFTVRNIKNTLVMIVASDKGLTGAFNTQVFKAADLFLREDATKQSAGHGYRLLPIGKKAFQYATKNNYNIEKYYVGAGDYVKPEECAPIAEIVLKGFLSYQWDRVIIVSTHFRTTLRQEVLTRQLLPMSALEIKKTVDEIIPEQGRFASIIKSEGIGQTKKSTIEHIFEPSPQAVLESLIPHLLSMQLYHIILEANASEHSARRVAMKAASDNAEELSRELTLVYNKARQANITTELIEITSTQQSV